MMNSFNLLGDILTSPGKLKLFIILKCFLFEIIFEPRFTTSYVLYLVFSEQVLMLTGKTAAPDFLKKITWITMNHHKSIEAIDTVYAYHFGVNFLVEVHIVLPEMMIVREAHDIQVGWPFHLHNYIYWINYQT